MSAFAPATGMLTAPRALINALVQETVSGDGDALAVDALLAEVGAGSLAAPHPALAAAIEPLRVPIIGVRLAKTGFLMLIDHEHCELAGVPALRTLVLEQVGGLATVVLEQWRFEAAEAHWTVTATADLAAWARLGAPLRAVAATVEVDV